MLADKMSHVALEQAVTRRYLSIRTDRARAILTLQHQISKAVRRFLDGEGFTEFLAPIIGPATDPGIRGARALRVDFYGKEYVVMTSMILYKQMAVSSIPKIYSFSPNVRLEPAEGATTGRHLAEFYQVDLEVAEASLSAVMDLGDRLLSSVMAEVTDSCREQLEMLGRTLRPSPSHLPRIKYSEALEFLSREGMDVEWGQEIPWECESVLSQRFATPFWVTDYPVGSRGFYYLVDPDDPEMLRSMDLILPEGFGEVASGGEREHEAERVVARMRESGEDTSRYAWYIDMLRQGVPPSAGFGIGLERLTRYVCGAREIWECSPFPKVPGIA
ncbi:MAG: asparagine synthetase A [Candidatus Thorarchaeota archaeon]